MNRLHGCLLLSISACVGDASLESTNSATSTLEPSELVAADQLVMAPIEERHFRDTGPGIEERMDHHSVTLADGCVLIAGGRNSTARGLGSPIYYATLWDPHSGKQTQVAAPQDLALALSLTFASVVLHDGQVFLMGPNPLLWNPTSGVFQPLSPPPRGHQGSNQAVVLRDGRVLVAGKNPMLVWSPQTDDWSLISGPFIDEASATVLDDGRVLVVGGFDSSRRHTPNAQLARAEAFLFDPQTSQWETTGSLHRSRGDHRAVKLPDNRVMVLGGKYAQANRDLVYYASETEIWDLQTGLWTRAGSLSFGFIGNLRSVTPLATGHVLVTGGGPGPGGNSTFRYVPVSSAVELWSPSTQTWSQLGRLPGIPRLHGTSARAWHTANRLLDGSVLIVGGTRFTGFHTTDGRGRGTALVWEPKPGSTDSAVTRVANSCVPQIPDSAGHATSVTLADGNLCYTAQACPGVSLCRAQTCDCETCDDGAHNGFETDRDCGGPSCDRCVETQKCNNNRDCQSNYCTESNTSPTERRCANPTSLGTVTISAAPLILEQKATIRAECSNVTDTPTQCWIEVVDSQFGVVQGQLDEIAVVVPAHSTQTVSLDVVLPQPAGPHTLVVRMRRGPYVLDEHRLPVQIGTPSCTNDEVDAGESDLNCGGTSECLRCGLNQRCQVGADCDSQYCKVPPSHGFGTCQPKPENPCQDKIRDFGETDIDCGRVCSSLCQPGQSCLSGDDCLSGHCLTGQCWTPDRCDDGVHNGFETDRDCGGPQAPGLQCPRCALGASCGDHSDCDTGFCLVREGAELGVCELPTPEICANGQLCLGAARCDDRKQNGLETDRDCGGPVCGSCLPTQRCKSTADCLGGQCSDQGRCIANDIAFTTQELLQSSVWHQHEPFFLGLIDAALPNQSITTLTDLQNLTPEDRKAVIDLYRNSDRGILLQRGTQAFVDLSPQADQQLLVYAEYRYADEAQFRYDTLASLRETMGAISPAQRAQVGGRLLLRDLAGNPPPADIVPLATDIEIVRIPAAAATPQSCYIDSEAIRVEDVIANVICYYNRYKDAEFEATIRYYLDTSVVGRGVIVDYQWQQDPQTGSPLVTLVPANPFYEPVLTNLNLALTDFALRAEGQPHGPSLGEWIAGPNPWPLFDSANLKGSFVTVSPQAHPPWTVFQYETIVAIVQLLAAVPPGEIDVEWALQVLSLAGVEAFDLIPTSPMGQDSLDYYSAGTNLNVVLPPLSSEVRYWRGATSDPILAINEHFILMRAQHMFPSPEYNVVANEPFSDTTIPRAAKLIEWFEQPAIQTIFVAADSTTLESGDQVLIAESFDTSSHGSLWVIECINRLSQYHANHSFYFENDILKMEIIGTRCEFSVDIAKLSQSVIPQQKAILIAVTSRASAVVSGTDSLFRSVGATSGAYLSSTSIVFDDLVRWAAWTSISDQWVTLTDPLREYLDSALQNTKAVNLVESSSQLSHANGGLFQPFSEPLGTLDLLRLLFDADGRLTNFPRLHSVIEQDTHFALEFSTPLKRVEIDTFVYGPNDQPLQPNSDAIVVNIPESCVDSIESVQVDWLENYDILGGSYAKTLRIAGTHGRLGPQETQCKPVDADGSASADFDALNADVDTFTQAIDDDIDDIQVFFPALPTPNASIKLHGNQHDEDETVVSSISNYRTINTVRDPIWPGFNTVTDQCMRPNWRDWTSKSSGLFLTIPCVPPPKTEEIVSFDSLDDTYNSIDIKLSEPVVANSPLVNILTPGAQPVIDPLRPVLNIPIACQDLTASATWGETAFHLAGQPYSDALRFVNIRHYRQMPESINICQSFPGNEVHDLIDQTLAFASEHADKPKVVLTMPALAGRANTVLVGQTDGIDPALDGYHIYQVPTEQGEDLCAGQGWRRPFLNVPNSVGPSFRVEFPCFPSAPSGGIPDNPAQSCNHILHDNPNAPSRRYWLDPDGEGGASPLMAFCDMVTEGGGWTIVNRDERFFPGRVDPNAGIWPWTYLNGVTDSLRVVDNKFHILGGNGGLNQCANTRSWLKVANTTTEFRRSYNCVSVSVGLNEQPEEGVNRVYRLVDSAIPGTFPPILSVVPGDPDLPAPDSPQEQACQNNSSAKFGHLSGRVLGFSGRHCWAYRTPID